MPSQEEQQAWIDAWGSVLINRYLEDEDQASFSRKHQNRPNNGDESRMITNPQDESLDRPWLYESSDGKKMVKASLIPGRVRTVGVNMPMTLDFIPTRMNITYDEERKINNISFF
ncbi:hypothetical protein IWW50_007114 [Coemansia erecta]|nr:hypothetical protein IWW50_007114 [Coemansia erecta]